MTRSRDTGNVGYRAYKKNYLINGNRNTTIINQRGFAGGQPAAGVYGYDMWKGDVLGTRIEQVVENTEVINETFTISWVGGTGTADVNGVTGLNSGDSFTLNTSGNFSVIVPTDATYIMLNKGAFALPFPRITEQEEFEKCTYYYWRLSGTNNAPIAQGAMFSATDCLFTIPIPNMRVKPTWNKVTIANYSTLGATMSGSTSDFIEYAAGSIDNKVFTFQTKNMTGGSSGSALTLRFAING